MLSGILLGLSVPAVIFIIFLVVFWDKLREMREKENSVYKRLFQRK